MSTHGVCLWYGTSRGVPRLSPLCLLVWDSWWPSVARAAAVSGGFHGPKGVRVIEVRLYIIMISTCQ